MLPAFPIGVRGKRTLKEPERLRCPTNLVGISNVETLDCGVVPSTPLFQDDGVLPCRLLRLGEFIVRLSSIVPTAVAN